MAHTTKITFLSSLLFLGGAVAGCDVDVEVGESETADETKGEGMESGDTVDPEDTGEPGDTSETGDTGEPEDTADSDPGFDVGDDPGDGASCDPLLQDCLEGEGCYPSGDGVYDCSPAGSGDEACESDYACVPGLTCLGGACVPFCDVLQPDSCGADECIPLDEGGFVGTCGADGGSSGCDDPDQVGVGGACFDRCSPLVQDCPDGEGCFFATSAHEFVCDVAGTADENDVCDAINSCGFGLACVADGFPSDGALPGQCTPYCDLDGFELTCAGGVTCSPFFEEGTKTVGNENVGVCPL